MPHTIRLHRVLRAPPGRVYRAFLDADALCKWVPPHGFTARMHDQTAVVGGTFAMSFTSFSDGTTHRFGGSYLEMIEGVRLRYTYRFDDPGLPGEMVVTVSLTPVPGGTDLEVIQDGVPDAIPADACHLGWQESLAQLAHLVEPGDQDG